MVKSQTSGLIDVHALKELLEYNQETGVFLHKAKKSASCGTLHSDGCIVIRLNYRLYKAHRLAWLYSHGEWPISEIDHIDGNRSNNAIFNLRDVPHVTNQQNVRRARVDCVAGLPGVNKRGGSYRARIRVNGKYRVIGSYKTAELAFGAYVAAKRVFHPGNTL